MAMEAPGYLRVQVNMMVFNAGGLKATDLLKIGVPLQVGVTQVDLATFFSVSWTCQLSSGMDCQFFQ